MPTLQQIEAQGKLCQPADLLSARQLPERFVYCGQTFQQWVSDVLPTEQDFRDEDLYPEEQVTEIFRHFILGRPMVYGWHYKQLKSLPLNTWELRTRDVRIFGYFYRKSTFVAVCGEMKHRVENIMNYDPYIRAVRAFMDSIDLDPPPCIMGASRNAVL